MEYEVVMGLEVHCELSTQSKLFCSCSAKYGADANENVCPACTGMPGIPPVANKRAIELGMLAGLVTNSEITRTITFDKKNYFYPDLPTGYQITQLFAPICKKGYIDIKTEDGEKRINITRIHIEEDAGKLVHDHMAGASLVDYNRAGVPLAEIVSEPDFNTSREVVAYLEKLRSLFTFAGVSDCKMQEGSMRADINISVRKKGSDKLGTRVEIKNMNSLKAISRAIEYESQRQIDALLTGQEVLIQETRRWDDEKSETFAMRNKEDADDYRYFPNPDIMPIYIDDEWLNEIKASLPEMAESKYNRLTKELGLPESDSRIITDSRVLCDIFDEVMEVVGDAKTVSNWLMVDLIGTVKAEGDLVDDISIDSKKLATLIQMVEDNRLNRNTAKDILVEIYINDIDPEEYMKANNLGMLSDDSVLIEMVQKVIKENESIVAQYLDGSTKVLGFMIGKIMKETKGKANPKKVNEYLVKGINEYQKTI